MSNLQNRKPILRCLVMAILLIFGSKYVFSQAKTAFEGVQLGQAKTSLHDDTPAHCMAYIWWNRISWDSLWQEIYAYNTNGELIETTLEEFLPQQGFYPHYHHLYHYNGTGQLVDHILQQWTIGAYKNSTREMWYKDTHGNDSLYLQFQWIYTPNGPAWDTLSGFRNSYVYATNGAILSKEESAWTQGTSGGYYASTNRTEYHYLPNMEYDSVMFYSYSSGNWVMNGRWVDVVWNNFSLGQVASYVTQLPNGGWSDIQRMSCNYNGLDSDCTVERKNTTWDSTSREYQYFDADSHMINIAHWINSNNLWEIYSGEKFLYTYDGLGRTSEIIYQVWDPLVGYLNNRKYVYDAQFTAVEAEANQVLKLCVYPNPLICNDGSERIQISLQGEQSSHGSLKFFDLQGRIRMEAKILLNRGSISFPISSSLEAGTYAIQISVGTKVATQKFLIIR